MRKIKGKRCLIIYSMRYFRPIFLDSSVVRKTQETIPPPDISCRILRRVVLISNGARKSSAYPSTHRSQYLYFLICENSIALYRYNVKCIV